MSWFRNKVDPKPEQSVCRVCQHFFVPHHDPLAKEHFPDFCLEHCKDALGKMRRAIAVKEWALENWEKLEPRMLREKKARENKIKKASMAKATDKFNQCSPLAALAQQQGALSQAMMNYPTGLGGYGRGFFS